MNVAGASQRFSPGHLANAGPSSSSAIQDDSPEAKKLKKAATEFEAMLLAKWWSSMKESGLGSPDESDPGHDTLGQMGMQAMSTAVASRGGLGIASMLVHSLLSNPLGGAKPASEAPSAKLSNNKA